ncbi:hypothetical protein GCM10022409_35720 [Hymenobacter glaciei]|uniref:Uncharacterized protein n=1 Tax=Hymenobacter glaciei TaxID=877209 RepID=A0ABP7UL60_9BACT
MADDLLNQLKKQGTDLRNWTSRAMSGVKSKLWADGSEYEVDGGVRQCERKKPARKAKCTKPVA